MHVEVVHIQVNKGRSLEQLCRWFGVPLAEVFAIGDGENDAEMLTLAGTGVAMANAKPKTKAAADLVLEWSNDEDGVAKYLGEKLLGEKLLVDAAPGVWDATANIGAGAAMREQGMSFEEWCAAKNAGLGPPISSRVPDEAWEPEPEKRVLRATRLPGIPDGMPAVVVHDVLTTSERAGLIHGFPNHEGEEVCEGQEGYMGGERVGQLYRDRVVSARILSKDEKLASLLGTRLAPYIPEKIDGGKFYRVNPGFRFVHYEEGGHQAVHIDGREPGSPLRVEEGWVQSRLTLQVYLNSHGTEFGGGGISFTGDPSSPVSQNTTVKPAGGDVVVFYQERLNPPIQATPYPVSYTHLRAHETPEHLVCRLLLEKKKKNLM
eukprot:TRINITY_DN14741_c0_g1_i4.p1 TRINITY_DN14741_c0_g1~~TRINITY_DN14741_c0_g1_i4.p1  ORF type:complete len:376 (+),score=89.81 TRINITY_DN14741_c0_g1_i4:178-1305(+)